MLLEVARDRAAFMVKNAVYLVLISLIILSIYFVTPDNVGPRLGAAITSCLTTAIVQGKLDSNLPSVATLVAIEYAFYIIYALVYLSVLITLIANAHYSDKLYNKRLRIIGAGAHCTISIATIGCYYYLYYL